MSESCQTVRAVGITRAVLHTPLVDDVGAPTTAYQPQALRVVSVIICGFSGAMLARRSSNLGYIQNL